MTAVEATRSRATLQRQTFHTSRLLDFFSEKELTAQTGHAVRDWPIVAVKELIDNALDACEEAGVAPMISVTVDEDGIEVADNGPGLPADTIEGVLDYTVRVSSREAYVSPTRGAQGNALKTIVGMPFALDPRIGTVLEIDANGVRHVINCAVDHLRQKPVIERLTGPGVVRNSTSVRVRWPKAASSNLLDAKGRFLQITDNFAWLNPHLTLTANLFGDEYLDEATDPAWSKWKPSDPAPAHWYTSKQLARLIGAYLAHDQDHGRIRTVRELVTEFRGLSATAKQKAVLEATGLSREPLTTFINDSGGIDDAKVFNLLWVMKAHSKPVKPQDLGIIGEDHLAQRFADAGADMETFAYRRVLEISGGLPVVIETAFAYCAEERENRDLITGINWSPALVNPFRQLGYYSSLDSLLTEQRAGADEPVILVLHVAQPGVQYLDRGKSAVVTE